MTEIPEVKETGSAGTQEAKSGELIVPEKQESPFPRTPIADAVRGLGEDRPRSMGNEATTRLVVGSFLQLSNELSETKSELKSTRGTLDTVRSELAQCQTQEAVLRERVSTAIRWRHLRNVAIAGGVGLLGIGIELSRNNFETQSYIVLGIALLFIVMGWFWPASERRK